MGSRVATPRVRSGFPPPASGSPGDSGSGSNSGQNHGNGPHRAQPPPHATRVPPGALEPALRASSLGQAHPRLCWGSQLPRRGGQPLLPRGLSGAVDFERG